MSTIRRTGMVMLAIAAVVIFVTGKPGEPQPATALPTPGRLVTDYSPATESALSDYRSNNANAESAPQQQVVNGWVARDLLTIQTRELNDALRSLDLIAGQNVAIHDALTTRAPRDDRPTALLLILTLAVVLWGFTAETRTDRDGEPTPAPIPVDGA